MRHSPAQPAHPIAAQILGWPSGPGTQAVPAAQSGSQTQEGSRGSDSRPQRSARRRDAGFVGSEAFLTEINRRIARQQAAQQRRPAGELRKESGVTSEAELEQWLHEFEDVEVEDTLYELVNPRIVRASGDDRDLEGCLSIPGYVAYVNRHERVWVVAQDRRGKKFKVSGIGLLGRALQHELDHLDGKLYIDYLDSMEELIPVGQSNEDDVEVREATSALA